MPLTNAQKQQRARDKRARTMARWEAALREIADAEPFCTEITRAIARNALSPEKNDG